MRHRFIIAITLIVGISLAEWRWHCGPWANVDASNENASSEQVDNAYRAHDNVGIVTAEGTVESILADDTKPERGQRFMVRLPSGLTIGVTHKTGNTPRISGLTVGSVVKIHGEYEWNDKGGVVHGTHKDTGGIHENGWIEFNGRRFE